MRFFILTITLFSSLYSSELYNTNLLSMRGIDPTILNTTLSNTRQNAAYRMKIEHHLLSENRKDNLNYYLITDPFPSYGTEMQIQISKANLDAIDPSDIQHTLDELMGTQLYIQHSTLYDASSFKLVKEDKQETIISFTYNEDVLPRELKHFKQFTGYVYISDGKLQKIETRNTKRLTMRGIEVDNYQKATYFKPVVSGGYLISKEELSYDGHYNDLPYSERLVGNVIEYWNTNRKLITFETGQTDRSIDFDDDAFEVISVDLDRTFPLLGKEARKAGFDLPKPFGITLVNMFQDTNMHMTSFKIDGSDINFDAILDGDSTYRSLTYAPLIRADVWVLPFVSVALLLGATDTTTNVTLASDSGLNFHSPLPLPDGTDVEIIKPGASVNLDPFVTNALLYGVGATVAGGFDNYFTTIDFQYVIAYTPAAEVSVDMMIITPLVGYTFTDYNTRLFIGAQYQRLAQSLTFNVDIPGSSEKLSGEIGLRSEEWAGVVGTDYTFTRNWSANLLYSQGIDRRNVILGIAYRF